MLLTRTVFTHRFPFIFTVDDTIRVSENRPRLMTRNRNLTHNSHNMI